jgi:hypothetical protein
VVQHQVKAAHRAFLEAGAQIVETVGAGLLPSAALPLMAAVGLEPPQVSYQITVAGFRAEGLSAARAAEALALSVRLAEEALEEHHRTHGLASTASRCPAWFGRCNGQAAIAASVGHYGAHLANGSEYRGDYEVAPEDLLRFYEPKLAVLVACQVRPTRGLFGCTRADRRAAAGGCACAGNTAKRVGGSALGRSDAAQAPATPVLD